MKGYNLPIDYVLYEMSYVNMIMYGAVIPSPHYEKDGKGGKTAPYIIMFTYDISYST